MFIKNRKLKSQQLAEFALIAPLIVGIIVLILEFGYLINIRMSLADAVKMSIPLSSQSYSSTAADKKAEFQSALRSALQQYMTNHNLPYEDTLSVSLADVDITGGSSKTAVLVQYRYTPFFMHPVASRFNGFGILITQVVSNVIFETNSNAESIDLNDMGSFWKAGTDLDGRIGILDNYEINGTSTTSSGFYSDETRKQTAFLVRFTIPASSPYLPPNSSHIYSRLINWWGQDLLPSNLFFDINTGNLVVYSPYYSTISIDTGIPFSYVLTSLGFSHAVFASFDSVSGGGITLPSMKTTKLELASSDSDLNAGARWCDNTSLSYVGECDEDMSDINISNNVKDALSANYNFVGMAQANIDAIIDNTAANQYISEIQTLTSDPSPFVGYVHSFYDATLGAEYFLKLVVPNKNFPNPTGDIYQFYINLDSNGRNSAISANPTAKVVDIVDVYMDNDGDGIPNAWDNDILALNSNFSSTFDNEETSVIPFSADATIVNDLTSNGFDINTDSFFDDSSVGTPEIEINAGNCLLGVEERTYDILQKTAGDDYYASLPFDVISGTLNSVAGYRQLPETSVIGQKYIVRYEYTKTAPTTCSTTTDTFDVAYLKYNNGVDDILTTKLLTTWDSSTLATELSQKVNFIHGTQTMAGIDLDKSSELDTLENGIFDVNNKAQVSAP